MKKLLTMLYDAARHIRVPALWRHVGRPLVAIAGALLLAILIVHGESWAIRQAPELLTPSAIATSEGATRMPEDSPDAGALPVAILH
jgi:hypothetical protein